MIYSMASFERLEIDLSGTQNVCSGRLWKAMISPIEAFKFLERADLST